MGDERRRAARIAVEVPCRATGAHAEVDAVLRDVSAVGARLVVPEAVADDLEPVSLEVPAGESHEGLSVKGRVMYHRDRPEGVVLGVQFLDLDAEGHRRLMRFLEAMLAGEGGGQREHPRVSQRIDVTCRTKARAQAVLEDVSKGGLRLRVPEEMDAGEPIEVSVTFGKLDAPLSLKGRVLRTKTSSDGRVFAAVKLDPLEEDAEAMLEKLLEHVVGG